MSLPGSVVEVLKEHVTLEVEGIDRMDLNVYQPWISWITPIPYISTL